MISFKRLVNRGGNVMREWGTPEGLDESSRMMIAELGAIALVTMCGNELDKCTPEQRMEKASFIKTVLTSAVQVGRTFRKIRRRRLK